MNSCHNYVSLVFHQLSLEKLEVFKKATVAIHDNQSYFWGFNNGFSNFKAASLLLLYTDLLFQKLAGQEIPLELYNSYIRIV